VIGVGNRLRGDDAIGLVAAERLRTRLVGLPITCARFLLSDGDSPALLAAWAGERRVLLLDALRAGAAPGTVHRVEASEAPLAARLAGSGASTHGLGVAAAVELGRALGRLPASLVIYGVEPEATEHGAPLSDPCERALEPLLQAVEEELRCMNSAWPVGS
jgi:hydrogenase maturation protease